MRTDLQTALFIFSIIALASLAIGIPFLAVVLPAALISYGIAKLPLLWPKTL